MRGKKCQGNNWKNFFCRAKAEEDSNIIETLEGKSGRREV